MLVNAFPRSLLRGASIGPIKNYGLEFVGNASSITSNITHDIMRRLVVLFVFIMIVSNLHAQNSCASRAFSQRIDSVCNANSIKLCSVFVRSIGSVMDSKIAESRTSHFRFDDYFLIINDNTFYNLDKLLYFHLNIKPERPDKNQIDFFFQGS